RRCSGSPDPFHSGERESVAPRPRRLAARDHRGLGSGGARRPIRAQAECPAIRRHVGEEHPVDAGPEPGLAWILLIVTSDQILRLWPPDGDVISQPRTME